MPNHFYLQLDRDIVGRVLAYSGGSLKADVTEIDPAGSGFKVRHLKSIRYEDVQLTCTAGMSSWLYDWVNQAMQLSFVRKTVTLIVTDLSDRPLQQLEMQNAFISGLTLPALDASSRNSASMELVISPDRTTTSKAGSSAAALSAYSALKPWSVADFRFTIYGLEKECAKVTSVGPLHFGVTVAEDSIGDARFTERIPGKADVSNLSITVASEAAEGFHKWFESFAIKDNASDVKSGQLDYMAPGGSQGYISVKFGELGIIKVSKVDGKKLTQIDFYCDGLSLRG
jgi:hypothetical protein